MLVTLGHGTLDSQDFIRLLQEVLANELVDVRSYPGSRRVPQFGREALESWVPAAGVAYRWEQALGGRRRETAESRNIAWRQASFRAYADYQATEAFGAALADLIDAAVDRVVVVMCAESVWWRCHRRLIADAAVLLYDADVRHLFHDGRLVPHRPSAQARVERQGRPILVYDNIDPDNTRQHRQY